MWYLHISRFKRLYVISVGILIIILYIRTYLSYLTVSTRVGIPAQFYHSWLRRSEHSTEQHPARTIISASDEEIFRDFLNLTETLRSKKRKTESQTSIFSTNHSRALTHAPRRCRVAPWEQPELPYSLTSDTKVYFSTNGSWNCFIEGTMMNNGSHCLCHYGWHGNHCDIPDVVWYSDLGLQVLKEKVLDPEPRFDNYRRIIQAFPFNMEFDQLDARLAELGDIVDVFLILESNYTAFGEAKPLYLLDKLRQGYYNTSSCKIVHVFLDYFPDRARKDGWVADRLHRDFLSSQGLVRQLADYHQDDLFVLTDADEIPSRESLMFLKLHDGYPQPVGIWYEASMFGYFWMNPEPVQSLPSVVTVGMLTRVLFSKAYSIRNGVVDILKRKLELNQYLRSHDGCVSVRLWSIGNSSHPAGWHCSWCLPPEGIRNKLMSAQNGDFPRWGNYPAKLKLDYISRLVGDGFWFDNVTKFKKRPNISTTAVPRYFLDNSSDYKYLLVNPYRRLKPTEKQTRLAKILERTS